jgi:UPF0716 family protein affecting phage T7 exclusion
MFDARRTWLRRLGTLAGLVIMIFAFYIGVLYSPNDCLPSTRTSLHACDVGEPSHPHFFLGVVLLAAGIGVLVASRRVFRDE